MVDPQKTQSSEFDEIKNELSFLNVDKLEPHFIIEDESSLLDINKYKEIEANNEKLKENSMKIMKKCQAMKGDLSKIDNVIEQIKKKLNNQ